MTAMDMVKTIATLAEVTQNFLAILAKNCGTCEDCGHCEELDTDYIKLPDYMLETAGIPKDAKLIAFAEEDSGIVRVEQAEYEHFLLQQGEKLIPSGREKRLSSDHSITVRGNEWYDHAAEQGGYTIDFVKNFYNLSFPDAVTMLLGGNCGTVYHQASERMEEPKKPFELPSQNKDMRRIFAYLIKHRCLDSEVLSTFAREKLIYEP